jgi:hypothetical protein
VEKNLRNNIEKLKDEQKIIKVILRYPTLYQKYNKKKFEEISKGMLGEDRKYLSKNCLMHSERKREQEVMHFF